ncbi:MAG: hypothetical protein M1541_11110 [Acidobacteria bacterium]|nr:hypothetical protein [Acidobacteriota bacterium]
MGSLPVADGKWHHASAVIDRRTQRLSLFIDGRLDAPDGNRAENNPADISMMGASKWPARVTVGSLGGQYPFSGSLQDVAILAGALPPGPDAEAVLASACAKQPSSRYVSSGSYVSPVYDWGVRAHNTTVTVATELHTGRVTAIIETSDDGFRTVRSKSAVELQDGIQDYPLEPALGAARAVRVRSDLSRGPSPLSSPLIDGFRIVAHPATQGQQATSRKQTARN